MRRIQAYNFSQLPIESCYRIGISITQDWILLKFPFFSNYILAMKLIINFETVINKGR